jgi:acyl carrier protein
MSLTNHVQDIFRKIFKDEKIQLMSNMQTGDITGWDSFKNIEILLACENKFDIRFRSKEIDALKTVGDLVAAIEFKLSNPK